MEEIQAQVLEVSGKQTSRGTIYEVKMSDGFAYTAWEAVLAAQANALLNQMVSARVEHTTNTRNGRTYNNHTLKEIALPGSLPPLAQPVAPGAPVAAPPV